jgi:hypothetical protein
MIKFIWGKNKLISFDLNKRCKRSWLKSDYYRASLRIIEIRKLIRKYGI